MTNISDPCESTVSNHGTTVSKRNRPTRKFPSFKRRRFSIDLVFSLYITLLCINTANILFIEVLIRVHIHLNAPPSPFPVMKNNILLSFLVLSASNLFNSSCFRRISRWPIDSSKPTYFVDNCEFSFY